ncbi:MAG: hypothetical protein SF051_01530 [Elusimicrobiota bacterium]|nr:hypothetical protein [Elusimicrobiota bacterium]
MRVERKRVPYFVYAIELDPEVKKRPRFVARNPDMLEFGRCFYVGQSIHEPECRYRQHKECHGDDITFACICAVKRGVFTKRLSNNYARRFGVRLHREAYEGLNPIRTRKQAERLEDQLARDLQADGHGVWWA